VQLLNKITLSGRSKRMELLPTRGCVGVISLAALDEGLHPRTKITIVEFAPATGVKIPGLCVAQGPGYILLTPMVLRQTQSGEWVATRLAGLKATQRRQQT
jgi:hypothetical protein